MPHAEPSGPSLLDRGLLALSMLLPALVAATHLTLYAEGARDEAVIRAVGLGFTGGFHTLDAWLSALFAGLPVGTRATRAELPGVLLLGAFAGLLFTTTRRVIEAVSGRSRWNAVVAAVSTATVTLSYPCQHEAVSVGGGLLGAVLVLLPLVVAGRGGLAPTAPLVVGLLVLGVTYEVPVGIAAATAVLLTWVVRRGEPRSRPLPFAAMGVVALGGVVPFAVGRVRSHVTPLAMTGRDPWLGAWGNGGVRHTAAALTTELGEVLVLLAVVGLVWGLSREGARPRLLPLVGATLVAIAAMALGAACDDERWSALGLVGLAGVTALAAVAMLEGVVRVARARLPLASASAALVVVLEATFPAIALDDAARRESARPAHAMAAWDDAAFGALPSGAIVLVSSPDLYARLLASKSAGQTPGDLQVLPTFDPSNEAAAAALSRDPRLVPLFRDLALSGAPVELSLSTLAAVRPLVVADGASWERTLARHLVASGLLSTFEAEPRGGADRKHALEAFEPARARLEAALGQKPDLALVSVTSSLLVDRALLAGQIGERENALLAIDEVTPFAKKDWRIDRLAQRIANAHGPIDVHDLTRDHTPRER